MIAFPGKNNLEIHLLTAFAKRPFSSRSAYALFRMDDLLRLAHFLKLIHSDNPFCKTTSHYAPFL